MFINGDYLFCYPKQQLALQIKQLLATHQIAFAQVLAATDKEDQHRIRAVFRQDLTKIDIDLHGVKEANAKKLILKYKRTPEER
jgi:enoyl-[acyl-carrier-protein] reductase (NADH)